MARLIDADTLMKEFAEFVKESNNSDFADVPNWNDAVSLLGSAPTVEAIPIEWIRNYVSIWISEPYKNFVLNMINVWEKENEAVS